MNVLLITADQWRGDCVSAAGHPLVRTPHVDALAADGVLFARHYCQAAPCGPARASLLTGLYQMNHRVCRNGTPLDDRHDNIAHAARRLGYEPALFGYTDTAADPRGLAPGDPRLTTYEGLLPGFDWRRRMNEDASAWFSWLRRQGVALPDTPLDVYLPESGAVDPPGDAPARYPADRSEAAFLVEGLLDHIDERGDTPWFAHVAFLRPHPPFIAPEPYNTLYAADAVPDFLAAEAVERERESHPFLDYVFANQEKGDFVYGAEGLIAEWDEAARRQIRATYYGLVSEVDAQIGRVIDHLKQAGLYDDTLIVVTSDHAEMAGDHHLFGKLGYFDQSYHVPLIIRAPGMAGGGRVDAFTESVDVVPTVIDLLGGPVPRAMDGASLKPFLAGEAPERWRDAAHWEYDFREVATGRAQQAFGLDAEQCALAVIRDERFKYVHFTALPPILFDLQADPAELTNVADDPAYASARIAYAEKLLSWRARHLDRTLTGIELTADGPVSLG